MLSLAITAALITQSYGGQMSVAPNLSEHDCAEGVCVALHGTNCETYEAIREDAEQEMAKKDALMKSLAAAYFAKHPTAKEAQITNPERQCEATFYNRKLEWVGGQSGCLDVNISPQDMGAIKHAECVR